MLLNIIHGHVVHQQCALCILEKYNVGIMYLLKDPGAWILCVIYHKTIKITSRWWLFSGLHSRGCSRNSQPSEEILIFPSVSPLTWYVSASSVDVNWTKKTFLEYFQTIHSKYYWRQILKMFYQKCKHYVCLFN